MTAKIALVGSPNVGKSVIFNRLTGVYVTVSNYPGTTVEVARGSAKIGGSTHEVIDTPGLYSIYPVTEEERVALRILTHEKPNLIVHVIDAKNLERMLPLTFQLMEFGLPIVVVLNMYDEARAKGINIGTDALSKKLGLPVVATVAITGQGIGQLVKVLEENCKIDFKPPEKCELPQFFERRMRSWYAKAVQITSSVAQKAKRKRGLSRLDKILISPLTGLPILALIVYFGLYKFVGVFGAGVAVDFFNGIFEKYVNPWLAGAFYNNVPWKLLDDLFVGEFGILTLGLRYAVAIILPIVTLFFLLFALIEDSGYLPRLAFLQDRAFKKIGLSGRAIIPMVLGLGCDTMAVMVTRTLPTKRERVIATLLLSLCVPCSAQVGVIIGLLAGTPAVLFAWAGILLFIFGLVGYLSSKLMPGQKPFFILEVPPMRVPQIRNVLTKTYMRMEWYFLEIVPLFILVSLLLWLGQMTGAFDYIVNAMAHPLHMMDLPNESATAFLFGFFRRDYGAAGLYDLNRAGAFTKNQLLISVVVLTLFLPCITQFLITIKERGLKIGMAITVFVLFFAFFAGVTINWILGSLGIVF